ncbi:CynX/NimT family MFS transporter [Streptococcus oricebi]|uniref:MFS transporter n=1 Tax=Streptococcus oricebi TaxID=1547447 RepID=A0ABS5B5T0_9STRE|nr:MFS transporter [Streptococcus oricebi]MBP2624196.1 MFS transporter [Streptococcus oricebi]
MKKQHSIFFIPGIVMLGIALRTPFTTIPTVLTDIASSLGVKVSSLGLLTTLPLIMFALFSALSPALARKLGLEKLLAASLLVLTLGSLIRIFNLPLLFLGTIIIGIAIAILNVLLPSVIQANQPQKIGLLTTIYTTSMGLSTTLAAALAVPITRASSWQGLVLSLTLVCFLALIIWLPNTAYNHRLSSHADKKQSQSSLLKNKKVWALIIFGGFQSLIFYTCMTWLPTLAQEAGLSKDAAGIVASTFSLISLPFSMTVPGLTTRLSSLGRKLMLGLVSLAGLSGIIMLYFPIKNFSYWIVLGLLLGIMVSALFPYLLVTFSLKTSSPSQTAQLSALAQTGGYLLAAFGPTVFGYSLEFFGSWIPAISLLLVVALIMIYTVFYVEKQDKIL